MGLITITEDAIRDYFKAHIEELFEPEAVNDRLLLRAHEVELGDYGRADLLIISITTDITQHIGSPDPSAIDVLVATAVEIKTVQASYKELGQLARYMRGMEKHLKINPFKESYQLEEEKWLDDVNTRGILIAPKFDMYSDFVFLASLLGTRIRFIQYEFSMTNGIEWQDFYPEDWYQGEDRIGEQLGALLSKAQIRRTLLGA